MTAVRTHTDDSPSRYGLVAERVPRRDPVVYGTADGPLSEEDLRAYERDGFLAREGVLEPFEVGITPVPRSNAFLVYNSVENTLVEPFGAPAPRPEFVATRDEMPRT